MALDTHGPMFPVEIFVGGRFNAVIPMAHLALAKTAFQKDIVQVTLLKKHVIVDVTGPANVGNVDDIGGQGPVATVTIITGWRPQTLAIKEGFPVDGRTVFKVLISRNFKLRHVIHIAMTPGAGGGNVQGINRGAGVLYRVNSMNAMTIRTDGNLVFPFLQQLPVSTGPILG